MKESQGGGRHSSRDRVAAAIPDLGRGDLFSHMRRSPWSTWHVVTMRPKTSNPRYRHVEGDSEQEGGMLIGR